MSIITVFTPSFNRKHTLPKLYDSLCHQTNCDFIWSIIDDGSTDGTDSLVQFWIHEKKISIQYHQQKNKGKMSAHNQGVLFCHTELFLCVDSDDYLTDNAIENIIETWNSLENKKQFAGIVAYRGKTPTQTMFGEIFPNFKTTTLHGLYQNGFFGETTLIYRTDLLMRYPFPTFPGEKFIPEAVVYDQIDQIFPLFVLPQILIICSYRNDGLTHSIDLLRKQNPQGWLYYYQQRIQYTTFSLLRYKYIVHAIRFCWHLKYNPFQNIPASKIEIFLAFPGSILLGIIKRKL